MKKILVRHSLSYANDKESPAFGRPEAHLREAGIQHAKMLRPVFEKILGSKFNSTIVAVSEMNRAQETANYAGFKKQRTYSRLNEYDGDSKRQAMAFVANGDFDNAANSLAVYSNDLISTPPEEDIWFTHGLVIAGLTWAKDYEEIRIGDFEARKANRFIPYFTSLRILDI